MHMKREDSLFRLDILSTYSFYADIKKIKEKTDMVVFPESQLDS